jgi:hypothetical protein
MFYYHINISDTSLAAGKLRLNKTNALIGNGTSHLALSFHT